MCAFFSRESVQAALVEHVPARHVVERVREKNTNGIRDAASSTGARCSVADDPEGRGTRTNMRQTHHADRRRLACQVVAHPARRIESQASAVRVPTHSRCLVRCGRFIPNLTPTTLLLGRTAADHEGTDNYCMKLRAATTIARWAWGHCGGATGRHAGLDDLVQSATVAVSPRATRTMIVAPDYLRRDYHRTVRIQVYGTHRANAVLPVGLDADGWCSGQKILQQLTFERRASSSRGVHRG